MGLPIVSVITPVYNGADYIEECMQSVASTLAGGKFELEHVVVDDGSQDESRKIIEGLIRLPNGSNSYRCRTVHMPHSGKPSVARNVGIHMCSGQYIFCLDHDDILLQNTLRYLLEHLVAANAEIVYGDFLRSDAGMSYVAGKDYCGKNYEDARSALFDLFKGEHFYQHSLMFTKRLWELVGGYDERITFGEDFDLCVRFILAGHIPIHAPITTHLHRNHPNGLTAVYVDRTICPIWLEEHRAHYFKHQGVLRGYLTSHEIAEIRRRLRISAHTLEVSHPSRSDAELLFSKSKTRTVVGENPD